MKREDIAKIFEGATDEQISKLLDINSADIGRAKDFLKDTDSKPHKLRRYMEHIAK